MKRRWVTLVVLTALIALAPGCGEEKPATPSPDKAAPSPPDTSWYWTAGPEFCERACTASERAFGDSFAATRSSPPPGKAEMYARMCREDCKRLDGGCGDVRRAGEDAFSACLARHAADPTVVADTTCTWIAWPPKVYDACELAVARKTGSTVHCIRMLDANRRAACEAELAKPR